MFSACLLKIFVEADNSAVEIVVFLFKLVNLF